MMRDTDRAERTVVLDGETLSIVDVIDVAKFGAKVIYSEKATQRSRDAYGLLLQAAAEDVPVYWFNRGGGEQRETTIFSGNPMAPENEAFLRQSQFQAFADGMRSGYGEEVAGVCVRAMMVIRANTMTYEAASPPLSAMLIHLLNSGITPVVRSRGTVGEGDLRMMDNVAAAMVGHGEVHHQGERVPASVALAATGIAPLAPFGADRTALVSTNAYFHAQSALLVEEARNMLEWADLVYAMSLLGMNSSVTPISSAVQTLRPYPWLNWSAKRVLGIIEGSYLFERDDSRIIQDPESLRASSQRHGSAWQAWADVRQSVTLSINSSDHNPAVVMESPIDDFPELGTPHFQKYFVRGGLHSGGRSGYILSTANWDPYPLANQIEAFTIALANLGIAIVQRTERFSSLYFTKVDYGEFFPAGSKGLPISDSFVAIDLWQELSSLVTPTIPTGIGMFECVEDLQANTRIKVGKARRAVELCVDLLGQNLLSATTWMDLRKRQDPGRILGRPAAEALTCFRQMVPLVNPPNLPSQPLGEVAVEFMRTNKARGFVPLFLPDNPET